MKSSLSIKSMMNGDTYNDNVSLSALDKPVEEPKRDKPPMMPTPTVNLEEQIRCVTVECVEKSVANQMEHIQNQIKLLEMRVMVAVELNATQLRNIWRHHSKAVRRLDNVDV